ncbi:MAG: lysophospholipid acyltransferase family protein [Pirellulaceae bacterium]
MVLKSRFIIRLVGWLLAQVCRLWLCTLRIHCEHVEPENNPHQGGNRGRMFCLWHEDLLTLGSYFGGRGIYVLISRSLDGELISRAIETLGFRTIRGSTNRHGASAAREIIKGLGGVSAAITPDGPRGPRREFQLGAVFLASRTGMPLVPIGMAYQRPWRLASWDKHALPRPFSRVVICMGHSLSVPERADKESLEAHRHKIAALMHESTERAESLLRRWRKGEKLPLISPEAKAMKATPLRKSA